MNDVDDDQLKDEIDEIMKSIDNIMEKIKTLTPRKEEESNQKDDYTK